MADHGKIEQLNVSQKNVRNLDFVMMRWTFDLPSSLHPDSGMATYV